MTAGAPVEMASLEHITVLRVLPGLGDMLCLVPALRSLRASAPHSHITLVGLPPSQWMLDRYPQLIDAFIPAPYWPGVPEASGDRGTWPAICDAWVRRPPDLALQLHGSGLTSNDAMLALPARVHAGHHPAGAASPGPWFRPWPEEGREVERLLDLVRWLGGQDGDAALGFPVDAEDVDSARRLAGTEAPYACVHPGASREDRRWGTANFARVADHLARGGRRVLITGSAAEQELATAVAAEMAEPAEVVAGSTQLGTLAALLRGADVLVSNDTGVAHLAAAVDARSVVVFTTSDAKRWGPQPSPRRMSVIDGVSPTVDGVIDAVDRLITRASCSPRSASTPS